MIGALSVLDAKPDVTQRDIYRFRRLEALLSMVNWHVHVHTQESVFCRQQASESVSPRQTGVNLTAVRLAATDLARGLCWVHSGLGSWPRSV